MQKLETIGIIQHPVVKKICFSILCLLALASLFGGLYNITTVASDCLIDSAGWLLKGRSPYSLYLQHPAYFKYSRKPTYLPQFYYLLTPFSLMPGYAGYLVYGLTGIFLMISGLIFRTNRRYLLLLLLLFATTPFRVNLGNGQFLFFHAGIFLLFDYLIRHKTERKYTFLVLPALLLLLAAKPTSFFWIPFFYPLNRKIISVYIVFAFLQLMVILAFIAQTGSSFSMLLSDYLAIMAMHSELGTNFHSVFFINFSTGLASVNGILVILLCILVTVRLYQSMIQKQPIDKMYKMLFLIIASFILVYHADYDCFLLVIPLFAFDEDILRKKNVFFLLYFLFLITERAVFVFISNVVTAYTMEDILIVLFIISIVGNEVIRNIKGNKNISGKRA